MIFVTYSVAGYLLTPFLRGWLKRRTRRGKEDANRLGERFGHAAIPRPPGRLIWLHAASVGEVQSMLTLVRKLLERQPAAHMLITTGTVTSAALVAQQKLPRTVHQFIPVDTPASVHRFLSHWHPDLALWVESEFWPQLILRAHKRGIPMLLVNARLSAKSFQGWKRWPSFARQLLGSFAALYAGSGEDAARLRALGAPHVIEAGNVKFDAESLPVNTAMLQQLVLQTGTRPLWLAASTHGNEEHMIAQAHRIVAQQFTNLLTIIVPRHAARGDTIAGELRSHGFKTVQRSKGEAIDDSVQLYLADTMGELGTFYHLAPIVFVGGSLIAHGGHNPLEPARQHCAIISGRHVHNFNDIVKQMQEADAIRLVADTQELGRAVATLLADPNKVLADAKAAFDVVNTARGATETILARVDEVLGAA